ncbi:ParA family protein [Streptomyces sp. VN1]|uniref:ParA family protein n=1 Tax=Streptomyces sp. VN1 TaxID=1821625 RepID=UPI001413C08C|nr:ParA family protein [Streptomyces sp. VN1]QIP74708.1 ParA family protein [Streptomyces sp. VN1]
MRETQRETVQVSPLGDDLAFLDVVTEWDMVTVYQDWKTAIVVPPTFLPGSLPRIVAICNQKGGAGKTVTTLELAMALVAQGLRVRIIDADPQQASMSAWLRFFYPEGVASENRKNLKDLYFDDDVTLSDITYATPYEGLHLVPSFPDLEDVESKQPTGTDTLLRFQLRKNDDGIDVTLIDCGPKLGPLTASALVAADDVVIPVQAASGLDVMGAAALDRTIATVKKRLNPDLRVAGVILTDFTRSSLARKIGGGLAKRYPDAVIAPARQNVRIGDAQLARQPLRIFESGATTVLDYDRAARILFTRGR